VSIHPYLSQELAILGWQSPISGKVTVCGTIQDGDVGGGDGIVWFIDRGATTLASGQFDNGSKQTFQDGLGGANLTDIAITQNEVLYFIVHPNQTASYDTTLLDFAINSVGRTCGPHVFLPMAVR
jgi:hypothetical protein